METERQLLLRLARRRFGAVAAEQSAEGLRQIAEPALLEELGEALLDCADGAAWLAAVASRAERDGYCDQSPKDKG